MTSAWPSKPLGDLVKAVSRAEIPIQGKEYRQIGVKLWGEGAYERDRIDGINTKYAQLFRAEAGDIILNKIWARNGSVAVVSSALAGCYGSSEFPMFSPQQKCLLPAWIHWLTKTRWFWTQCDAKSQGTSGKDRIRPEKFLEIEIPLPPIVEQQRIVARIEAVAAQVQDAQRLRHKATTKAALLLYASMKTMRLRLLGSGMQISPLESLTRVTAGGTPSRDNPGYWGGTIPWVKTGELVDGALDFAEEYITELGVQNSSAKVFPIDTILLALYGQGQTRGRTGRLLMPAATNQACCAILPSPERFRPRFIQYWLRSLYYDLREDAQGGAQPNWNGGMIKSLPIALPTLHEQDRIIDELDCLQTQVESLKRTQIATATELDALLPAILDKAFRGELV